MLEKRGMLTKKFQKRLIFISENLKGVMKKINVLKSATRVSWEAELRQFHLIILRTTAALSA